ncbi:5'-methylthioadenosine/S-adenosylhomocysteine nucleosidase [Phocoenobacter uteri]|uniref:5'-methylthioadenosine/S-adenosylhomocysteine nucleosidase n=1 Tax=Phocoenobacter uteri TaxID=146806 RepID=A0A379CBG8_9PAST|nr:5'-methylthioadenosine/S-adenosylhomocysteine nucleosidase [Phocoenobacter uteri]MDG6881573.1 5'-methylthioadenosine nucleosidase [Phocoenobacter uteri]SUB59604.1 5'-methylthioadenosine/S-adenosylhomocysteine nucleosidase [Phocoenobacter uteri]
MKKLLVLFSLLPTIAFSNETILVQGAMDMEVDYMISQLQNANKEHIGSWTFWKGKMGDNNVIISRTEIGLTNSAAATTLGIEKYQPTLIINQGTSGGHDPSLHQGDIVLGEKIVNFGAFRTEHKDPNIAPAMQDQLFFDVVQRLRNEDNQQEKYTHFSSDPKMLNKAIHIPYNHGKVIKGTIGTADQWNREIERINFIHKQFGTSSEEMETSAAAQVATAYHIPFIGIRILSNSEIHSEEFNPDTAQWVQSFVVDFIKALK